MNRFNLTFRGEILEGHDPAQVQTRLAQLLSIDDPALLKRCFSGDPVVLRRNLERKEAAALYARLRQLGILAELVKIGERGDLHAGEAVAPPGTTTGAGTTAPPDSTAQAPAPVEPVIAEAPGEPAANPAETGQSWAAGSRAKNSGIDKGPAQVSSEQAQEAIRRADLAAEKDLLAQNAAGLKAREKALKKALRSKRKEEAKRNRASERAREKTLAREANHKARLEAARLKAEVAEAKREAEAQALESKAQQEREQAEEAARREAKLALARAEEAARVAAAQAEREHREALERERREAEREERDRREQARLAEQQRVAAEKAAQREREKRSAEEATARRQAAAARRKREQAEASVRRKAEEARKKARELARQKAQEEEQVAQRRAMEEQAIQRAAIELAHSPTRKPLGARVRTRMEMPSKKRSSSEEPGQPRRKRQPGAPNLYSLRPFRNTPEIRSRAGQSRRSARRAFNAAAIATLAAIALAARVATLPTTAPISGATALAVAPQERLLLLAGDQLLLHDRAGVSVSSQSLASFGVLSLQSPLAFDGDGKLLAPGQLATTQSGAAQLLRCDLVESACETVSETLAGTTISALAVHPLDGTVFIADSSTGELLKVTADGVLVARAAVDVPERPVLRLDSGLLLMNSAQGPGISVFRYEDTAFGQHLDEILLLPGTADAAEFTGVRDFIYSGQHWWVALDRTGDGGTGLYRFDGQWQFVDSPILAAQTRPLQLVAWGSRILVADPAQIPIGRFNSAGEAEAPLVSSALVELAGERAHWANLALLAWRLALALCVLAAFTGVGLGALHRLRSLVYTSCHERGAAPVDEVADDIAWIDLAPDRLASLGRTAVAYAVLATGLVLGAIGLGASSLQLSALLLFLLGPAAALLVLQRSDPGHIGICADQLLLVDHDGIYHLGAGSRIHHRGPFLMIDDVTVFTGTKLLPAFSPGQVGEQLAPMAAGGVRVDRRIVTVKLLQGRHPLALGALAILAACAGTVALLSLQGIF